MKAKVSRFYIVINILSSLLLLNVGATSNTNQLLAAKSKTIIQEPKCAEIRQICANLGDESDDILIVECLQSLNPQTLSRLQDECQHVVWMHMSNMVTDEHVRDLLQPICGKELSQLKCQVDEATGNYLKCIVNNKEQINDERCLSSLLRLENVAFYDYRWISRFISHCNDDISKLQCGRIDHEGLTQSETVSCLQSHINDVQEECRREVFRLSEIQSDSIKLDRQLYLACAEDQMRYCRQFSPGSGRVYSCLMQHRHQLDKLSGPCQMQLLKRQKLIAQDYRISKGLMRACRDDIKRSHCRKQTSEDKSIRMAQILLCLESVVKNGSKVDHDCVAEMEEQRKVLLEDYRLSPEIVEKCAKEIKSFCKELEVGGKTIHCLMDHARLKHVNRRIGVQCMRALEDLVKETDIAEDWRVDPVLKESCEPVVRTVCQGVRGGNARVITCLMDNIGADHMTEECEEALIQIQYFIARDFNLDPQLYQACRDDAQKLCHAPEAWDDRSSYDPEIGRLVLPCLYRNAFEEDGTGQVKQPCFEQIKRVMRQRALSVDLMPEIEDSCLTDLAMFCFDKTEKGEEMLCLQNNMDKLAEHCRQAIESYTEKEGQNAELNSYIALHCQKIIHTLCSSGERSDRGSIMECLIANKNNPIVRGAPKCRISIEHFQLISLKDYRFTYKFKAACKSYVNRFCHTAKTKAEVIACLSEKIMNDTILSLKSNIQKDCRQQVKAQLFQQRENIHFDSKLEQACHKDIHTHCKDVEAGSAQVLECLQSTPEKKLTEICQVELFKVKRQETYDNSVDYALMTICADSIQLFCPKIELAHALECLKRHRDDTGFNNKCLSIVKHRMVEQNNDYRLNPLMQENCKLDIKKFCFNVAVQGKPEKDLNGDVINCLKDAFKQSQLSNRCEKVMASILRDQALDLQLNPLLRTVCRDELDTICRQDVEKSSMDGEECLKNAFMNKKIPTAACRVEIANMIEESQADINADPMLQQICALDLLKYCSNIAEGNGRHIRCLSIILNDGTKSLSSECRRMLSKRFEMYRVVAHAAPLQDFRGLYNQVSDSPAKHYFFFATLSVIATMFAMGIVCGRSTRRQIVTKNK